MTMENESRIAEREARRWFLTQDVISAQSAGEIASWYHSGQGSRAYSFCSTGRVQPDLDLWDFMQDEEYAQLKGLDRTCVDALMAYIKAEKAIRHSDTPHTYGTFESCSECMATCHCAISEQLCVRCTKDVEHDEDDCWCSYDGEVICYDHQMAIAEFFRD